jgi:hypothetical protein
MAINIPIVTEFVDAGLKSAQGAFDTFRSKVGEAEGGMGKFKAGAGVALDTVKANAGVFAAAAGGAIAGFASKAIGDFQDLALAVDQFSDKTNLTLDQSSRWNAYTSDLGIESDAMIKIFDKLGKAANDQIPAFEELGVEIAFGPDGTTDIEETFFRVIDKLNSLEDPAARARLRADLLGKGWMGAAEIINSSSSDIRRSLNEVGDFEIIDEDEIQKAKDLREAQDRLGDALAEISVKIGEELVPALVEMTELMIPAIEKLGDGLGIVVEGLREGTENSDGFFDGLIELLNPFDAYQDALQGDDGAVQQTEDLNQAWIDSVVAMGKARYDGLKPTTESLEDMEDALLEADEALAELKGNVDRREAWRNLIDEIDNVKEAAVTAFVEGTPAAVRESESALDQLRVELGEYILETQGIPTEKKTDFLARLETANLQEIEAIFNQLGRPRTVTFVPTVSGMPIGPGETPSEVLGRGNRGLGATSNVTVNVAGSVVTERDLVNSVRKGLIDSQRNGAPLVYSNS